ncbi:hypothetical protein V4V48_004120 [Vibrio mimicus]
MRLFIYGASGSGVTSIANKLSDKFDIPSLDSDDVYWKKRNPPYTEVNELYKQHRMFSEFISSNRSWIISGSNLFWQSLISKEADIIIFVELDDEKRLARAKKREEIRYGERILSGGDMYDTHVEFMNWSKSYSSSDDPHFCLKRHLEWYEGFKKKKMRINNSEPIHKTMKEILRFIED